MWEESRKAFSQSSSIPKARAKQAEQDGAGSLVPTPLTLRRDELACIHLVLLGS